ncbi:MAG: protein kinase [Pirellulales bacterium]|nr:protein kinase [Pirellulales bacterium]
MLEGIAAARLSHPHIVTVFEVGEAGPVAYIVSAYCQGRSLAAILAEHGPVPIQLAARWVNQLAAGVEHAHRQGVWHRDIKPGNVLLEPNAGGDRVEPAPQGGTDIAVLTPKLTDFGLAKLREHADLRTRTGAMLGTPAYMAPEQVDSRFGAMGPATDVYGLGAVLYELLTGFPPFRGCSEADVLRQVATEEPISPRRLRPEMSRDLEAIALACLEKSPGRRYESAGALADDLSRFVRGESTHIRPAGALRGSWKWLRRRPTRAVAVGLGAVSSFVVLCGLVWHRVTLGRADSAASQLRQVTLVRDQQLAEIRYASDVRLAYQAWESRDALQAVNFLSRQMPASGDADRRGFFWWRLWSLVHGQPRIIGPAEGTALAVAFSPDGATLMSAGQDGTLRLWNVSSGELLAELLGHTADVNSIAFSPDGQRLASAGDDETVRVWLLTTGQTEKTLRANTALNCVQFLPDGNSLVAGDEAGRLMVWNLDNDDSRQEYPAHTAEINQLAVHPRGELLATASSDGTIGVWRLASLEPIATLDGHQGSVTAVTFSSDGQRLASAGVDHTVRLWQVEPPQFLYALRGHTERVDSVAFTADSRFVTSAGKDGTQRIWDAANGRNLWTYVTDQSRIWGLAASPTQTVVATAGARGGIRLWPLEQLNRAADINASTMMVERRCCAFSRSRSLFAYLRSDGAWCVLNLETGHQQMVPCSDADANHLSAVWFGRDAEWLNYVNHSGVVRAHNLRTADERTIPGDLGGRTAPLSRVSPSAGWLAMIGLRTSHLLELRDLTHLAAAPRSIALPSFVLDATFTPDERTLLVLLDDATSAEQGMVLVDTATGTQRRLTWSHGGAVNAAAFSADGQYLAYSSGTRQVWVRRWDDPTAAPLLLYPLQPCGRLAFAPHEPFLIGIGNEGSLSVWSLRDGEPLNNFDLPPGKYRDLLFDSDGQWLALGAESEAHSIVFRLFSAPRGEGAIPTPPQSR